MKKSFLFAVILFFTSVLLFSACGSDGDSNNPAANTYAIGDTGPSGVGIVFYITDGGLHGLEAAPAGWNGTATDPVTAWILPAAKQTVLNGNTSTDIGTGLDNTSAISTQAGLVIGDYAAKLCNLYDGGGKTDWFLPSKDELTQLYDQKGIVGGLDTGWTYWSSSEIDASTSWRQPFGASATPYSGGKDASAKCRPIRAF